MEVIGLTRAFVYKDENRTRKLLESFQSILNDLMGVPIQKPGFSLSVLNILRLNWTSNQIKKFTIYRLQQFGQAAESNYLSRGGRPTTERLRQEYV